MNISTSLAWKKRSYYDVYKNHQEYGCYKWVHYLFAYDQIFARHLDAGRPLRLLEIGVQNGGSLEIWKKYLPPKSEIHGMDINLECLKLDFSDDIHFHLGDATDDVFVNHLFSDKNFDVIVDDGSHICGDVISTFLNLFKKINPGGIYIIEDLQASYWKKYDGGLLRKNSSIEFFKQFIDVLHADYILEGQLPMDMVSASFLEYCRQEISGISFFDGICVISKFAQKKYTPFSSVICGNIFTVASASGCSNIMLNNKLREAEMIRLMYATTGDGDQSPMEMKEKMEILLAHGIEAFKRDDSKTAIECLSAVISQEPDNPLPYAYLAFVCVHQGLFHEARDFIAQSARIAPERADLIAAMGEIFLKNGRPQEAVKYLREAVHAQPDLFAAYPAFAQSLHLTGQSDEAVSLLHTASSLPSSARANIRSALLQILVECGNLSDFTEYASRFSCGLPDDLLVARCLARFDENGVAFLEILSRLQSQLEGAIHSGQSNSEANTKQNENGLTRIAFMVGDFTSPQQLEQLFALFRYLPLERFFTIFISCQTHPPKSDMGQQCILLVDAYYEINKDDDSSAVEKLHALAPDILIDMEAYAPSERLAVFLAAPVPHKLLWGETPIPPIAPDVRTLAGVRLSVENMLPTVTLPEMGEVLDLPELPFTDDTARVMGKPPVLGCLVPAAGIGRNGWQLFTETLRQFPDAAFVINLAELGQAAQIFISAQFSNAGIDPTRLVFINACTAEEYCRAWQSIDLGLLPPVNPGGLALPTCLWMGRPCLVPDSILPWSQRPTALLKALGREGWIASGAAHYADLAKQFAPPGQQTEPDPALRERMRALGLADAEGFARGFAQTMSDLFRNVQHIPSCISERQ